MVPRNPKPFRLYADERAFLYDVPDAADAVFPRDSRGTFPRKKATARIREGSQRRVPARTVGGTPPQGGSQHWRANHEREGGQENGSTLQPP